MSPRAGLTRPSFLPVKESTVLTARIRQCLSSEEGVSSIEYALLGALIAVVCAAAVTTLGSATRDLYMAVCNAVAKANNNPPC